jgi:hypothetical protein
MSVRPNRLPRTRLAALLLAATACSPADRSTDSANGDSPAAVVASSDHRGLIHGRVTMDDGTVYEGRLRWGGDEEALWTHHFNGRKAGNPWVELLRHDERPRDHESIGAFGVEVSWDREADVERPFLARFGDIARIDTGLREIRVTLRSGAETVLDRWEADDLADGLRIWDAERGVVDIGEKDIVSVEFMPGPGDGDGPRPLHGTVYTTQGEFTGFLQWDRTAGLVADPVVDGLSFAEVKAIERRSSDSAVATLLDGSERVLSGTRGGGPGSRGVYVDDVRYGRVLVSWDALERMELADGGTGPGYDDFPAGGPLTGRVVTLSGERLEGRVVYDLDESETTETLDAPRRGVDYLLTFSRIESVDLPGGGNGGPAARITLRGGEVLELERAGDLGGANAGLLVFADGESHPDYVPWSDVARIEFGG